MGVQCFLTTKITGSRRLSGLIAGLGTRFQDGFSLIWGLEEPRSCTLEAKIQSTHFHVREVTFGVRNLLCVPHDPQQRIINSFTNLATFSVMFLRVVGIRNTLIDYSDKRQYAFKIEQPNIIQLKVCANLWVFGAIYGRETGMNFKFSDANLIVIDIIPSPII